MPDLWHRLTSIAPGDTLQIGRDPEGIPVHIGRDEWHHIIHGHPGMNDFRDLIVLAVTRPVTREPDPRKENVFRHHSRVPARRSISTRELPLRVRVVVKYMEEEEGLKGYVSTAFLTR